MARRAERRVRGGRREREGRVAGYVEGVRRQVIVERKGDGRAGDEERRDREGKRGRGGDRGRACRLVDVAEGDVELDDGPSRDLLEREADILEVDRDVERVRAAGEDEREVSEP